jgi:glycosyltransferase involved in cell wall biosynthesis
MRILLISARYLPHRGGLESVVFHLAQEYQSQGHNVRIVTNRYPRTLPAREEINGVQITRLHFLLPDFKYLRNSRLDLWLAGFWYQYRTVRVLAKIIDDFRPDIINNHYLNEVVELTGRCLMSHPYQVPWIISLHGGDVEGEPFLSDQNRQRFCKWTGQANGLTACSHFLANQAQELDPELHGKIKVIHNGVDTRSFLNTASFFSKRPYILAVGQLLQHKGFDLLIQAFSAVAQKYPGMQLLIAGEGNQRFLLEKLIVEKNLTDRVLLLGGVDETQVAALMAGCLFLAVPSRRESFGIVALEGMAAGKCVMASSVGGLPEFLSVPPNRFVLPEIENWAKALDEWIKLAVNGGLNSKDNLAKANQYDWSDVANEYLQLYDQLGINV